MTEPVNEMRMHMGDDMTDRNNLINVMRLVLGDNKGQVLTEALCLGIEASVLHYLGAIKRGEQGA